jgi:peptidyl-prolyl cis-trans isomerase A (cyclophilin A)
MKRPKAPSNAPNSKGIHMRREHLFCIVSATILSSILAALSSPAIAAEHPESEKRPPGLYMIFETGMGKIHCKLFEKEAPLTVRTIVGLATGKLSYIDPKSKQKVPGKLFYDGTIFHRVVPRFMIQGGDPLGTGFGAPEGPGFPFKDEFAPALRFDVAGRLAMANAGPNTNGSQFFITEVRAPELNEVHTIFGQCEDLDVVKAIARVPAEDERPLKDVIIEKVLVERIGSSPEDAPEAQ